MKPRVAHVLFPRPSLERPLSEFAWDAAKGIADSDDFDVEMILPVPAKRLARLSNASRSSRGAAPWPDGLQACLQELSPRATLVPYPPVPGGSTESAAAAVAANLIARKRSARPDLVHGSFLDEGGFVAAAAAKAIGCASVAVAHGSDARAAVERQPGGRKRRARFALRHATEVVAVSMSIAGQVARCGRRAELIRYTACPKRFGLAPRKRGQPRVLFVGRIERNKGVDVLLEAFAKIETDAILELVGKATGDVDVARTVERLGLEERVELTGELTRDELVGRYRASTCVALPSRAEGLPCVLVEALLVGRPVIASDVGGVRELVDSRAGAVVPAGDIATLVSALDEVITGARERRWTPRGLRDHALPMSWQAMMPKLEALTWQLVSCGSSS